MINVYLIDDNRVYIGEVIQQDENEKIKGITTPPIEYNSEIECIVWNGFNWITKPISYKTDYELQHLKSVARGKLRQNYQNRLVVGYTDSVTGISLSGDEISFQKLQLLSHRLNNKKNAGKLDGWMQPFFDKTGTPQQLPGQECIEFLDRYGDWWEELYMQEKIKQGQINQVNTKEALDEIDLDFPVEEE